MAETTNNILFKRGTQAALNNMQTSVNGTFYLTTDTNRLYIGNGTAAPALLNQTVQIVSEVKNLPGHENNKSQSPTKNDFFYCTAENILAVYNGNEWKQINPDTNDNDTIKVTGVTVDDGVVANESVTYNVTINQQKFNKNNVKTADLAGVQFALTLTKEDLEAIIHDPASVGLKVTAGTNTATVATQGTGADGSKTATVKGGSNVTVSVNNTDITIDAKDSQYTLGSLNNSGAATVRLTGNDDAGGATSDVVFKAGKDLTVAADTNGITYTHATVSTTQDTASTASTLTHGGTVDVVTGVTTDNGHVTKVTTKKYQLPADTSIQQINGTGDNDWKNEIEETGGKKFTIDFSSDAAKLKEDLEKEISDGLAAANTALTYKGGITSYAALALKTNVEVGDVYLLTSPDQTYKSGDMFIAVAGTGATVTNGVISGTVEWTYVPSGDELNTDTLFKGDVTVTTGGKGTGKIEYAWSASRGADDDGNTPAMPSGHENLTIEAGKDIVVGGSGATATIGHAEYDAVTPVNSSASSAASFTAVTGVTLSNGHVTGINTQTYTPDTYTLDGENDQIQLKKGTGALVNAISVEGDSWIDASVANDKLSLAHAAPQTTGGTTKSVTNNTPLAHGGKLNILTGITYDAKGHVSSVTTGDVTLPADNNTTYDMFVGGSTAASSSVSAATANPYVVLRNSGGQNDTIQLKGDSGSLAVSGNAGAVTISMVWGSF